jgi:shikimate kinase
MSYNNIVLIGMMGSGKSTIGKKLSQLLKMIYIDMDHLIESREGQTITEIFRNKGEDYFRDLELIVTAEISKENRQVISTGGGVVLNPENIEHFKKNSAIFYLKCEVETLANRLENLPSERPLLKDQNLRESLSNILEKRSTLYENAADYIIDNNDVSITIGTIIECMNREAKT